MDPLLKLMVDEFGVDKGQDYERVNCISSQSNVTNCPVDISVAKHFCIVDEVFLLIQRRFWIEYQHMSGYLGMSHYTFGLISSARSPCLRHD